MTALDTTYSSDHGQVAVFLEPLGAIECGEFLTQLKNSFSRRTMLQGVSYEVPATASVRRDHSKSRGTLGSRLTINSIWVQTSPSLNTFAFSRNFYKSFEKKKFSLLQVQLRNGSDSFSSQTRKGEQHTLNFELCCSCSENGWNISVHPTIHYVHSIYVILQAES